MSTTESQTLDKHTNSKALELVSRVIPSAFFLIVVIRNITELYLYLTNPGSLANFDRWRFFAAVMGKIATIAFLGLMSILFLIRMEPLNKAKGVMPRIMAIVGTFFLYLMTLFPRRDLSLTESIIATSISLVGTFLSVFTLAHLGRSFSLMAEARRLVRTGPYRLVRHPLYVSETIASIGVLMQFRSLYTILIFVAYLLIQFQRMKNEEAILEQTFPDYKEYAQTTARVIPGVF